MTQPSPYPTDPFLGQELAGRYLVVELIARGGMGNIYKAIQQNLGREYAIKVLRKEFCTDVKVVKRFLREALAVSQLRHPHTVQVFDTGQTPDGTHYIVMEYLVGMSLDRRIAHEHRLDPELSSRLMGQSAAALNEAHKKGIVHRDLKPANIFVVTPEEVPDFVKILDFGIAKFYTGENAKKELTKLTAAGSTMGTPHYMAPEQIRGEDVDGRADVYSLGIIFWECLVGRPPFVGDAPMEIFLGHLEQQLPPPSREVGGPMVIPPPVDAVVARACAKDPAHRFQTMSEFKAALDSIVALYDPAAALVSQRINIGQMQLPAMMDRSAQAANAVTSPERAALHHRKGGQTAILVGLSILAIALVVAIGVGIFAGAAESEDESEAETVADVTAHVKVYTYPSGAAVIVDGDEVGKSPLRLDAPAGEPIEISLELGGYDSIDVTLTPVEDSLNGALVILPSAGLPAFEGMATVNVDSTPGGAEVLQNGIATDFKTPIALSIPVSTDGESEISLVLPGFLPETYTVIARRAADITISSSLLAHQEAPANSP